MEAAVEIGIKKVKLTGGEPLLRRDIGEIVEKLSSLSLDDLAITTNGFFLKDLARELREKGLKRVNINVPSLNRDTYRAVTGVDGLSRVLEGVKKAISCGLKPIKINVVLLKGVNEKEISSFMEYAKKTGVIVQLIELEPIGITREFFEKHYFSLKEFEEKLSKSATEVRVRYGMHGRRVYLVNGVQVEIVRWAKNPIFCMHCTRLRITSNGWVKTCLMKPPLIDLRPALKRGDKGEVKRLLIKSIALREPYFKPAAFKDRKLHY